MCNAYCQPDEGIHAHVDWSNVPVETVASRDIGGVLTVRNVHHMEDDHGVFTIGTRMRIIDIQPVLEPPLRPTCIPSDFNVPILNIVEVLS